MVHVDVILALAGNRGAIDRLARHDASLAAAMRRDDGPINEAALAGSRDNVHERLCLLRKRLLLPFLTMLTAGVAAVVLKPIAPWHFTGGQLGAASVFLFAWAGLGRLGWGGQSYIGTTSVEQFDSALFHTLCWFGMYLAFAAAL